MLYVIEYNRTIVLCLTHLSVPLLEHFNGKDFVGHESEYCTCEGPLEVFWSFNS